MFTTPLIPILESIDLFQVIKLHHLKYLPNMLALCWHNTLAYYAFCSAGIFDRGLFLATYTADHC